MGSTVGSTAGKATKELVPGNNEVLKNRVFGMPTSKMTRHQRVSFTVMVKIAYDILSRSKEQKVFEFDTKDFIEMIGLTSSMKQNHLFSKVFVDEEGWEQESEEYALEKTLRDLITKEIIFRFKDDNGKTYKIEATSLLAYFKLTKNKITFEFSEWIRSRILTTSNAYIMKIPIIASFKSGYTVTLFEQLEQRRDFKRWDVSVKVLRKIFGLDDDKYQRFGNFRSRVLDVAKNEIIENTNYSVSYELVKKGQGGAIQRVVFTWYINKTSLSEFKEFIRIKFKNRPLIELPSKDKTNHLIQVSEKGLLYNARNPDFYYSTSKSKDIWKYMFNNQEKMIIKQSPIKDKEVLEEKEWNNYYGKNVVFFGDSYNHIILISKIPNGDRLKVKFKGGELLVITEKELVESVVI